MNKIFFLFILIFQSLYGFQLQQNFNIKTYTVESKNIAQFKEFYGTLQADKKNIHNISLRFDAFITKLYATQDYAYIKKDEQLVQVYSKEIYNLFDELQIAKKSSNALYKSVVNKFKLYNISPDNKVNNSDFIIRSDYEGYIMDHNVIDGTFIKKGKSLFKIVNIDSLWGIIDIYQKDINYIKKGMKVELYFDRIDTIYTTKIDTIYPTINTKNQTISVKVNINNKDHKLFPNMFAKAKIYTQSTPTLFIPKNCLVQRDNKKYVFLKDGDYYSSREVKVEKTRNGFNVLQGLNPGDIIVQNALFLLDSDAVTNGLHSDDW